MIDFSESIADLSPEKRALLALRNPLSFAQQRLWFIEQLMPGTATYNISFAVNLRGALDSAVLEQSVNRVIERHEVMRTTFATIEGAPIQVISPAQTIKLLVTDLSHLPPAEQEAAARERTSEQAGIPFDLARGPLIRVALLRLAADQHILLFVMHHIISDGWSTSILIRELAAFYLAQVEGSPSRLPELPIQYADFAYWQRQWLQGEVLEEQMKYWKEQLGGELPVLSLPTDRARPAEQSFRGSRESVVIGGELSEGLKGLSRREGVTLFMVLLAAFKVLLHRYTSQDDIVVGSPIANRNRIETEGLIGFFVNTLVLRTDLSDAPTFRQLLARVREVTLGAYAHQDLPFEKLIEELHPQRNLSYSPLFQVVFALEGRSAEVFELPGLSFAPVEMETTTAKFDLSLIVSEGAGDMTAFIMYNTDLFDAPTVARMLGHFKCLLEGMVEDPDRRLSELPLLTEEERRQILVEWNETKFAPASSRCVHERFEAEAMSNPNGVAVYFEGVQMTYGELNRRANQLANHLVGLGVDRESRVAVCVERSPEMIVSFLAVLKAGAAYVSLDPTYPKQWLTGVIEDAGASVVVTHQHLAERVDSPQARLVRVDSDLETILEESDRSPGRRVEPENLAYVIYTSGSTGRPKGVAVGHSGLMNLVCWHQSAYGVTAADRATQVASTAFDASVWELWPYLSAGASIHIPGEEARANVSKLARFLVEQEITLSFIPTPVVESLLKELGEESGCLRAILTGGDRLQRPASFDFSFDLINHYGPTENTVVATSALVSERAPEDAAPPIGRPIHNAQAYILDRELNPVPAGVAGELYIGGASLARGYLDRPSMTAERFVPNPFGDEPGMRLYKTGDLTRYLPDGNIEFLGRIDDQVKIRGFRIEQGEVEATLASHPQLRQVVVMARQDERGEKSLVAYIVSDRNEAPTVSALRGFLRERLPDYMIPSAFVALESLPQTPNGKIDRRALPAPERERPQLEAQFVAPGNRIEEMIAAIWAEALQIERIGIHDNFFDLGGHSLLAIKIHERICKELGRDIPLLKLFQYPTVHSLASFLSDEQQPQFFSAEQNQDWAEKRKQALKRRRKVTRSRS